MRTSGKFTTRIGFGLVVVLLATLVLAGPASSAVSNKPFGLFAVGSEYSTVKDLNGSFTRTILHWDQIEKVKGSYNFTAVDAGVKLAEQNNVDIILTLTAVSSWGGSIDATKSGSNTTEDWTFRGYPKDPEAWQAYVTQMVERYDGDGVNDMPDLVKPIKYWQIENEWLWQWTDGTDRFVQFTQETSDVIRAADPSATVIGGALTAVSYLAFAEGYVTDRTTMPIGECSSNKTIVASQVYKSKQGRDHRDKIEKFIRDAKGYYDVIDVHAYRDDPYLFQPVSEWLKEQYRLAGYGVNLVSLENGGPYCNYTTEEHSIQVVTRNVMELEAGASKIAWSSLIPLKNWSADYQNLALKGGSGTKKPAYYTYKTMTDKLNGYQTMERVPNVNPNVYMYKFDKNGKYVWVVWSRTGTAVTDLAVTSTQAKITNIITVSGQTVPTTETLNASGGVVTLNLTRKPIFVEEIN